MKKIIALLLVAMMLVGLLAACGEGGNPTDAPEVTDPPAAAKTYQFSGKFEESGGFSTFLNVAFLLDLNADGTAVVDKYAFSSYDASDVATNQSYVQSYLSGTWKEVEKDGVACLQIKLAYKNSDGTEANGQTCYAYDVAGVYSFDMTFPVVPGQSYTRIATMEGKEGKTYTDDNAFIQAYKAVFVAPEHVGTFVDAEKDGTAYLQADGTLLLYSGYDQYADGKWTKTADAVTISVGGEAVEVTMDGNKASFSYSRSLDGNYSIDFVYVCEDISALPTAEVEAGAPYTVAIDMGGNATTAELTVNDDGTANLKVFTDIPCTYEKIGSAVVLTPVGELEGYAAQIWMFVKHAYILNEDHSMTGIENAFNADGLALLCLDETNMKVEFPAYGMSREGFTYTLVDNALTVTAPDAETLGAFAQIWQGAGSANWTVDGNTATKAG